MQAAQSASRWLYFAALAAGVCQLRGQTPALSMTAVWDVRESVQKTKQYTGKLAELLREMKPEAWKANGAPAAYLTQWESARRYVQLVEETANKVAADPDRLRPSLELVFHLQSLESLLESLGEAVSRYQDHHLADRIAPVIAEGSNLRESLRNHVLEAADLREQQFAVADQEAQRCRAELSKHPGLEAAQPPRPRRSKK